MEYIGEVIPNHEFIRRTKEYEAAGLKHYYFMTLKTDEVRFFFLLIDEFEMLILFLIDY